jgi:hypothetical protein
MTTICGVRSVERRSWARSSPASTRCEQASCKAALPASLRLSARSQDASIASPTALIRDSGSVRCSSSISTAIRGVDSARRRGPGHLRPRSETARTGVSPRIEFRLVGEEIVKRGAPGSGSETDLAVDEGRIRGFGLEHAVPVDADVAAEPLDLDGVGSSGNEPRRWERNANPPCRR